MMFRKFFAVFLLLPTTETAASVFSNQNIELHVSGNFSSDFPEFLSYATDPPAPLQWAGKNLEITNRMTIYPNLSSSYCIFCGSRFTVGGVSYLGDLNQNYYSIGQGEPSTIYFRTGEESGSLFPRAGFSAVLPENAIRRLYNQQGTEFIALRNSTFNVPVTGNGSMLLLNSTWTISGALPEPSTWSLLIGGFGMVGLSMRRRRAGAQYSESKSRFQAPRGRHPHPADQSSTL